MAAEVLTYLHDYTKYAQQNGLNDNNGFNGTVECENRLIDDSLFYQLALIPAIIIVLLFAFTQTRRNLFLGFLKGRPAVIYPMEMTSRSNRISYACAFGSTVYLISRCVFEHFRAIDYDGPLAMHTVIVLVSMLIFGLVYLPVFACLALSSVHTLIPGTLYTWMLLVVNLVRLGQCSNFTAGSRALKIMEYLPHLLCLIYLSICMPYRLVKIYNLKKFTLPSIDKPFSDLDIKSIKESDQGQHVKELLTPQWNKPDEEELPLKDKIKEFLFEHTYRVKPGFKYSARILATMLVGFMLLYYVTVQSFSILLSLYHTMEKFVKLLRQSGTVNEERLDLAKEIIFFFTEVGMGTLLLSTLLGLYGIMRMLTGYRRTMYLLYRGELKEHIKNRSNASLLVGSMKYPGYQVTYIAWGWLLQCIFFFVVCFLLALAIKLLSKGYNEWLLSFLSYIWPIVFWVVTLNIAQLLTAKYAFLKENGRYLALTNRRVLFLFSYFSFFYNIFLGVFSSLLRIIKGLVIGVIMLPRLDHSTLPTDYTENDPGYNAYVGFMFVESSQSHPVVVVFLRLLLMLSKKTNLRNSRIFGGVVNPNDRRSRRQRTAVFNWQLFYTLLNNPDLRFYRKGYMQNMRKARELGIKIPASDGYVVIEPEILLAAERSLEESAIDRTQDKVMKKVNMIWTKLKQKRHDSQDSLDSMTPKSNGAYHRNADRDEGIAMRNVNTNNDMRADGLDIKVDNIPRNYPRQTSTGSVII